jgi:hypothetical protein
LRISPRCSRTFRSRAKLPPPSREPRGRPICKARALLRCRVQSELEPQPRERRPRAKVSWLSCAGCEMTMARRFSFCLDPYPCFCGSFFVAARRQRADLRSSKRSTNTKSVFAEKLPVAKLLTCLLSVGSERRYCVRCGWMVALFVIG